MLEIRPYEDSDAPEVSRFFEVLASQEEGSRVVTLPAWRAFVGASFNRDGRDFLVAREDGELVGLVTSTMRAGGYRHFRVFVLPRRRNQGIGSALFARVEAQGGEVFLCNVAGAWRAGSEFLRRRGFSVTRRELTYRRDLSAPLAFASPAGYELRPYAGTEDDAAWIRLHQAGFGDAPDFAPISKSDVAVHREAEGFALWMAETGGESVGYCQVGVEDDGVLGLVENLVVDGPHRGKGVGRALLRAGLAALHDGGFREIQLCVRAENEPAVRLYESEGFTLREEVATYERALPSS